MKPKSVRISTPQQNITSLAALHGPIELACQCVGSRPPGKIQWWRGEELLEPVLEKSNEESLTTDSFLSLVPTLADNGKVIACRCHNPRLAGGHALEDIWAINIYCEYWDKCSWWTLIVIVQMM